MLTELAFTPPWAEIGLCLRHGRARNKTEPLKRRIHVLKSAKLNTPGRESLFFVMTRGLSSTDLPLAVTLASRWGGDFVCCNGSAGQAPPLTKMPV